MTRKTKKTQQHNLQQHHIKNKQKKVNKEKSKGKKTLLFVYF